MTAEYWRTERRKAASRFKPKAIRLLLIAEAPPNSLDRYFYFPDVAVHDSLFRYVSRLVLGMEPDRENKRELLKTLRDEGVFLIDVSPDPIWEKAHLREQVTDLVGRVKALKPEHIILIKKSVWDVARWPLMEAGLPLVDLPIPFPGSGQQRRFESEMGSALDSIGWVAPGA